MNASNTQHFASKRIHFKSIFVADFLCIYLVLFSFLSLYHILFTAHIELEAKETFKYMKIWRQSLFHFLIIINYTCWMNDAMVVVHTQCSFGCSHRILYSNRYLLNSPLLFFSRFFFSLSKNMKWHYFTFRFRILTRTHIHNTARVLHDKDDYGRLLLAELAGTIQPSIYIRIIMRIWYSSECSSTANNVVCRTCVSCEWMAQRRVRCACVCLPFVRAVHISLPRPLLLLSLVIQLFAHMWLKQLYLRISFFHTILQAVRLMAWCVVDVSRLYLPAENKNRIILQYYMIPSVISFCKEKYYTRSEYENGRYIWNRPSTEPDTDRDGPHFLYYFYKWANKTPACVDASTIYDSDSDVRHTARKRYKVRVLSCVCATVPTDVLLLLLLHTTATQPLTQHILYSGRIHIFYYFILYVFVRIGFFFFTSFAVSFGFYHYQVAYSIIAVMGKRFVARFHLKY